MATSDYVLGRSKTRKVLNEERECVVSCYDKNYVRKLKLKDWYGRPIQRQIVRYTEPVNTSRPPTSKNVLYRIRIKLKPGVKLKT